MNSEVIELRKSGKFYNCFGDDAIIIHHLMKYKIVPSKVKESPFLILKKY